MADTENAEGTVQEEPQGTEGMQEAEASTETDWKAEARKWEARAKKSQEAEKELERLKEAQMTEQERERARAERAEAELEALRAEKSRMEAAAEIADRDGIPAKLLAYCADKEAMEAFAADYRASAAETEHVRAAARSAGSRIVKGNEKPSSSAVFAEIAGQLLNQ